MKHVAIYARVSTEEQAMHGYSIEAQVAALTKYAKEHDMIIEDIYIDEGISARKKMQNRKEFVRLIEDASNHKFELILFTKLDRWFRNIADYYRIQEVIEKYGVNWKTIYENYDTTTASGRLHINIMLSVAQDEADRTSERIRSVFANKVKNKEIITGKQPYAYKIDDKKIVVDSEKAEIIKAIFNDYKVCRSINAVKRHINEEYNLTFSYDFYKHTLRTSKYTGEFRGIPDYYPAIISKELFEECKDEKISFVRENQTKRVYIFSGLIVCKECGRKMNGIQTVTSRNKFYAYRCKYGVSHSCSHNLSIREDLIEQFLINNINEMHQTYLINSKNDTSVKRSVTDKAKIKSKLKKLKDLYLDDLIDKDTYKADYEMYMRQISEIDITEIEKKKKDNASNVSGLINLSISSEYNKMSRENKRVLWQSIIKQIIIDNDENILVVFQLC